MELEARNMSYTTLDGGINNSETTIAVANATVFPSTKAFIVTINNERILIDSVTGNNLNVNASGRGYDGSSAAAHLDGATVSIKVVAGYINWVNDAVAGKYDKAGGSIAGNVTVAGDGAAELGDLSVANDLSIVNDLSIGNAIAGNVAITGNADITGDLTVIGVADALEIKNYKETMPTATSGAGNITIDVADGNVRKHTMTDDVTFIFTAPGVTGKAVSFTLILKMAATAKTITWPASVTFDEDTAPNAPDPDKVGVYTFFTIDNGARWYGSVMANHMTE